MTKREKRINNAIAILIRSTYVASYACWDDLITTVDEKKIKKEFNSLELLVREIIAEYRIKKYFISPSIVLNEMYVFFKSKHLSHLLYKDLLSHIDSKISALGMKESSISIVPLHSYRVEQPIFPKQRNLSNEIIKYDEYWIVPSTGDFNKTLDVIKSAFNLWIGGTNVSWNDYAHYQMNSVYLWLKENPFLLIKSNFSQQEVDENIYPWNIKYRYINAKIYARSIYDTPDEIMCNGRDTLDIYHILYIKKELDHIYHIGMNPLYERDQLVNDFSNVNVKLSPSYVDCAELIGIYKCIDDLYERKVIDDILLLREIKRIPKIQKLHDALYFFCKSFKTAFLIDQIIFLQTAFETLLIDIRTTDKRNYLLDRVSFLLKGKTLAVACDIQKTIGILIDLRNGIIHSGLSPKKEDIDIKICRYIFLQIFKEMADKIDLFSNGEDFFTQYIYEHTTKLGKRIFQIKQLYKKAKIKIRGFMPVTKKKIK